MKKITKLLALSLALCMMFSTVAFAAENETSVSDGIEVSEADVSGPKKAPAAPLTQFYILGVSSSDHTDIEIIQYSSSFYPVSTVDDHGGTWLRVYTVEIGYAGQ